MALKTLFSITDAEFHLFDVKFDDVTLQVSVWWNEFDTVGYPVEPVDIHPLLGQLMISDDAQGQPVHYIGINTYPYAAFPEAGHILGQNCNGLDLYYYVADGAGRSVWGDLIEANSTSCGFVPTIIVNATVAHAVCFGSSTGSITLQVSGGNGGPYTFLWSDGATTQNRFNIPHGLYSVTVQDSNGTSTTLSNIAVGQNSQIQVVGSIGNDSIELQVSGGVGPYTYQWADGPTTKDRSGVGEGTYVVTVTDSVGCFTEVTFRIMLERFFFSKNPVLLELQADNLAQKPNLRFICEVWVEKDYMSGEFIQATPEPFEHPADADGGTVFDVAEILDAFVEPHLPGFNLNSVIRADKAFRRFYLKHTEAYGDPVAPQPFTTVDNRYVVYGGLDAPEHFAGTYFSNFRREKMPFFTWEPQIKKVFADQPEYLFFMPEDITLDSFLVRMRLYFTDGTSQTINKFVQEDIRRFELYCIPAGYLQLGLALVQPAKTVRSWEVWIADYANRAISEVRRYTLTPDNVLHRRYVLYANSVGGYNTLSVTGKGKYSLDAEAQFIERKLPRSAGDGDTTVISKHGKRTLQLSTGHKTSQEMHALQDFLISEDVQLVGPDRYVPVRLGDSSVLIDEDGKNTPAFEFDLILPKSYRYTPALGPTDYVSPLTASR